MIKANELRIGNYVTIDNTQSHPHMKDVIVKVTSINEMVGNNYFPDSTHSISVIDEKKYRSGYSQANEFISPIPLSEDILLRLGYNIIHNSSAGNAWGFVINGVFSSDLKIIQWKTTEKAGKFYRGELELKGLHHLQNIHHALTGTELTLNP